MCCCRCMACRHQDMALRRQGMPRYLALMASLQGMAMGLQRHLPILATQQLPSSQPTSSSNQVCCLSSCAGLQALHTWLFHQLRLCIALGKAVPDQRV